MIQFERVADGRRRFFPASGTVSNVLLRDKRGQRERGLDIGRDYEIETGGVSLRRIPSVGEVVVILVSDRETDSGRTMQLREYPATSVHVERVVERLVPVVTERVVEIPRFATAAPDAQDLAMPARPEVTHRQAAAAPTDNQYDVVVAELGDGATLDAVKLALVRVIKKTNDGFKARTPQWQDELARRTAMLVAAGDMAQVRAAFLTVASYLRGQA